MADATDFREGFIKNKVSCEIGGRTKMAFDNSAVQIGYY
jgi:hypothetical protein